MPRDREPAGAVWVVVLVVGWLLGWLVALASLAGCGSQEPAVREFDVPPSGRLILEQYHAPCWRLTKWADGRMWFVTWPDGVPDAEDGRTHVIEWRWR